MKRIIYSHKLEFENSKRGNIKKLTDFKNDFDCVLQYICSKQKNDRKEDYALDKKVLYLEDVVQSQISKSVILKFVSAKYASSRNVINTKILEEKGFLKEPEDGDEERTHIAILFEGGEIALCFNEYNINGISFKKIILYLNEFIKLYHEHKSDNILYKIVDSDIVSSDFLKSLEKVGKIKAVTLTVDTENAEISDAKRIAGFKDLSRDVDLMYKPVGKGKTISHNTIKEFYKLYNSNKVKRVSVKAEDSYNNPIPLDTDKMKEKRVIEVSETYTGEPDSDEICKELLWLCEN